MLCAPLPRGVAAAAMASQAATPSGMAKTIVFAAVSGQAVAAVNDGTAPVNVMTSRGCLANAFAAEQVNPSAHPSVTRFRLPTAPSAANACEPREVSVFFSGASSASCMQSHPKNALFPMDAADGRESAPVPRCRWNAPSPIVVRAGT